jgi:NAD(P)-dependent dehydrogenase (short-subunit alcohol dehydrogenase family)
MKVAVVTGGAGGMGTAVCRAFLARRYAVAVLDLPDALAHLNFDSAPTGLRAYSADVRDPVAVGRAIECIVTELGPPSVLVTAAGTYHSAPLADVTSSLWDLVIDTNLTGTFNAAQACVPYMIASRGGTVVLISSIGGKVGWPYNHAYCASKAGVLGLMRVLALELASCSVTVNAICPGNTDTPMMDRVDSDVSLANGQPAGWFKEELKTRIPLGRMVRPDEVASLAVFLSSAKARQITGQAINIDGGLVPS